MEDLKELTKVNLKNLDKIFYPKIKATKAQVIEYYIKMAPKMLPIIKDRPLVLTRYPDGVDVFRVLRQILLRLSALRHKSAFKPLSI